MYISWLIIYMICLADYTQLLHDKDSLALHFNPGFKYNKDHKVIVCNSNQGGWGQEQKEHNFSFQCDEDFKVMSLCLYFSL